MPELQEEIHKQVQEDELKDAVILVFANKQDRPNALSADEMAVQLKLYDITSHPWFIQPCVATEGEGLWEGISWIVSELRKKH